MRIIAERPLHPLRCRPALGEQAEPDRPAPGASRWPCFLALLLVLAPPLAWAGSEFEVSDAWARETVPGQQVASVYLMIRSAVPARLIGVTTRGAKTAEIHSMKAEGGVMKMRRLDGLELPAGQVVKLEPGGNHIMLLDIRRQLKVGEHVRLSLVIEAAGKKQSVPVIAEVRPIGQ